MATLAATIKGPMLWGPQLTQALSALAVSDPCQPSPCSPLARCSRTPEGQAQCHCPENYHGDGKVCLPKDPCLSNFGGCPRNSTSCQYLEPGKVSWDTCLASHSGCRTLGKSEMV